MLRESVHWSQIHGLSSQVFSFGGRARGFGTYRAGRAVASRRSIGRGDSGGQSMPLVELLLQFIMYAVK